MDHDGWDMEDDTDLANAKLRILDLEAKLAAKEEARASHWPLRGAKSRS